MSKPRKNRREFLKTAGLIGAASILAESGGARPALAAAGPAKEKLAVDGGSPVRGKPLHSQPYGPQFYDDLEKQELADVLQSRSPFRSRREGSKVFEFERAYGAYIGVKHVVFGVVAVLPLHGRAETLDNPV